MKGGNPMLKSQLKKSVEKFGKRFDYDTSYMSEWIDHDPVAFVKLGMVQGITNHRKGIPVAPYGAAKITTAMQEDCGPCIQLTVNMALQAGVLEDVVRAIVTRNLDLLDAEVKLAVEFTEACLAHDPRADELRDEVMAAWGMDGLISLACVISSSRIYPTIKYVLGYGKACQKVTVGEESFPPLALQT